MCAPAVIGSVVGGAIAAGSKIAADQAAQGVNSRIARQNVQLAREQHTDALQQGAEAAAQARVSGSRFAARATAETAAGGLETTVGAPAAAIALSQVSAEQDAAAARAAARRRAWGVEAEIEQRKFGRKQAFARTLIGGVSTGLGAAFGAAGSIGSLSARSKV